MRDTLNVLSIGRFDPHNAVRDALLQRGYCHLFLGADYRDLFAIPREQRPEVAILHDMASSLEINASSEYIRRTWPGTKILVICARNEIPDDPLYDEWLALSPSQEMLLAMIEQLAAADRKNEPRMSGYQKTRE
jgi:hypothetical protein